MGRKKNLEPQDLSLIQHLTAQTLHFAAAAPEARAVTGEIVLALNRLAGTRTRAADIEEVIVRLLNMLTNSPVTQAYVQTMMAGLNDLTRIRGVATSAAKSLAEAAARSARRRHDIQTRYELRQRGDEMVLVETRRGSGKDSSVGRSDYDAAIMAMVRASDAGHRFDDLLANFRLAGGGDEPYRLRVILRFWRLGGPPIISRRSARYASLVTPQLFAAAADALWHQRRSENADSSAA